MGNEKIEQILECWNSLCYVQLVVAAQTAFGIEFNSDQIQRITSQEIRRLITI